MNKFLKTAGVPLAILVVLIAIFASSYNGLVNVSEDVDRQFANIESKLQRRLDLIPNLTNAVKGSMNNEKEIFDNISQARTQYNNAVSTDDKVEALNEMNTNVGTMISAIHENYPTLASNENVKGLMDELAGTENRISVERDRYNEAVSNYNRSIKRFPRSIIASMTGFDEKDYFKASENAQEVPVVDFD